MSEWRAFLRHLAPDAQKDAPCGARGNSANSANRKETEEICGSPPVDGRANRVPIGADREGQSSWRSFWHTYWHPIGTTPIIKNARVSAGILPIGAIGTIVAGTPRHI